MGRIPGITWGSHEPSSEIVWPDHRRAESSLTPSTLIARLADWYVPLLSRE